MSNLITLAAAFPTIVTSIKAAAESHTMRIEDFLASSVELYPEKVALVSGKECRTYREMDEAVTSLARTFRSQDIHNGDRVVVLLNNPVDIAISLFAILRIGATFVILSSVTPLAKLAEILNDCTPSGMIIDELGYNAFRTYLEGCQNLIVMRVSNADDQAQLIEKAVFIRYLTQSDHVDRSDRDTPTDSSPAALVYTSGSTGDSKAVIHSHSSVVFITTTISAYLQNTCHDTILNVLSLAHTYGLSQLLTIVSVGGTVVFDNGCHDPYKIVRLLASEKITGFALTPSIAAALSGIPLSRRDLPALRYISSASDALSTRLILRLNELLPHVLLFSMYGLTECIRVSYLPPDELTTRPTSIGRGLPKQEIFLVDEKGLRIGPDLIGELVVRGPNVMQGYWRRPMETARVLKVDESSGDRVLYTGDLFRMDHDGYFHFISRKDDVIKVCGEKVGPLEVEQVLCSLEGIRDAIVIGVPDPYMGQVVKAFVMLNEESLLTRRDIMRHCATHLERYKVPSEIEFRARLPRTPNGKARRSMVLADIASDG